MTSNITNTSLNNTASNMPKNFHPAPFNPPFWMANPHIQCIVSKLVAKKAPTYRRELVMDSFNESEVAYDFYDSKKHDSKKQDKDEDGKYRTPIVVLFHGLEGGSDSHYASTLAHQIHAHNWHFVVPHYRSCGGVPVKGEVFYNAGDTAEIHHVLGKLSQDYATVYAVGVSIGGNMLAKYMGEYADNAICQRAVVVSAPVDLSSGAIAMLTPVSKRLYTPYLLNPLLKKALETNLPKEELEAIKTSKTLYDFDAIFTAPRHGYRSANDYYRSASALPFLKDISKPTLIVTAKDDPFLGLTATANDVSDSVILLDTKHGGHIGFMQWVAKAKGKDKFNLTWLSDTAIAFFEG